MEGTYNGPPKTDAAIIPEFVSAENKELQLKARELAKATREKGMGLLYGQFPTRLAPHTDPTSITAIGSFLQGEVLVGARPLIGPHPPYKIDLIQRQVWSIKEYIPPMEKKQISKIVETRGKRLGLLPKTDRRIEQAWIDTDIPLTHNGKKGESDWVQFSYYMPSATATDSRVGVSVQMVVAVPPEIASQIEEQVEKSVYFPDAFLKALYPGYFGPNVETDIRRRPSIELEISDERKGKYKHEVRPYPQ